MAKLFQTQISELSSWVAAYICQQRNLFVNKAQPVREADKSALLPFFPASVLDVVLIARGKVSEPDFYPQLRRMGITNAPPFAQMAGITLHDLIVHCEPLSRTLLFHELVHAVQYRHLGVEGFAERYVRGFLNGGSYEEIPLEKQAYELEGRFASDPTSPFSVEAEVRRRLELGQL